MKMMRKGVLAAAIAAALLAACGGGDNPDFDGGPSGAPTTPGSFTAVVSFGDSLSDVGTYAPATSLAGNGQAPYFGGKFTTNTDAAGGDLVWVERVAATLGITVTPAEVGFAGRSQACPAALLNPALAGTCTAYGQGGSRVTDPVGVGHTTADGAPAALTVPVVQQIRNHLERFQRFRETDLIVVWAGNNDAFVAIRAFGAKAAAIAAKYPAGTSSEHYSDADRKALYDAQSAGQQTMKDAAYQLARYVKDEIVANGGRYVAVGNLPDSSRTPAFANPQSPNYAIRGVLSTLTTTFNDWLREALDGVPVRIIDMAAIGAKVDADPGDYGFANTSAPACDATKIAAITGGAVTDGSSLFCNVTAGAPYDGLRAGASAQTWFFADGVHPSAGGHAYYADQILAQLRAFGWIAAAPQ